MLLLELIYQFHDGVEIIFEHRMLPLNHREPILGFLQKLPHPNVLRFVEGVFDVLLKTPDEILGIRHLHRYSGESSVYLAQKVFNVVHAPRIESQVPEAQSTTNRDLPAATATPVAAVTPSIVSAESPKS
jgi:hypothetical protein